MELKQIKFTNENGNAIAKTREAMSKSFQDKLIETLTTDENLKALEVSKKDILIPLAKDKTDGKTVYARVSYSITKQKELAEKKSKKKDTSKQAETIINLFD